MYKYLVILLFTFVLVGVCNSQNKNEKIYLNSENSFVTVLNITTWYASETTDFFGEFVFVNPAEDANGKSNGDGYIDILFLEYKGEGDEGFKVFARSSLEAEGWEKPIIDTLKNSRIECEGEMLISSTCSLISDSHSGDFIILKYKTIKGITKKIKGILITTKDNKDYKYFYEKTPSGKGNGFKSTDN
jgi:hypothetical protein